MKYTKNHLIHLRQLNLLIGVDSSFKVFGINKKNV